MWPGRRTFSSTDHLDSLTTPPSPTAGAGRKVPTHLSSSEDTVDGTWPDLWPSPLQSKKKARLSKTLDCLVEDEMLDRPPRLHELTATARVNRASC